VTRQSQKDDAGILHVAGWYPGPWSKVEGNFVQDQVRLFLQVAGGRAIVVQVRGDSKHFLAFRAIDLEGGVKGYYLFTRLRPGRVSEALATVLLMFVLIRNRPWRHDALHFHVAYPLLVHVRWWHWLFRRPIIISEHWSAYHFNFHLPDGSKGLAALRRPFQRRFPVLTVSRALLQDIRQFARRDDFPGYVVPNVVPIHGPGEPQSRVPVLFCVSRWVEIKDPMPMLAGLALAVASGSRFELVIGGFGELMETMQAFVAESELRACTRFVGEMTKPEIASQLRSTDGFIFSSRYETFSVAAAEALGAGVPLIGPYLPAIAEYAGPGDWQVVETRDAAGWSVAACEFLKRIAAAGFDGEAIASRAAVRFSPDAIRATYRKVLVNTLGTGPGTVEASKQ
jgi:glycosyltransferase involved in cell wall biosynthesis